MLAIASVMVESSCVLAIHCAPPVCPRCPSLLRSPLPPFGSAASAERAASDAPVRAAPLLDRSPLVFLSLAPPHSVVHSPLRCSVSLPPLTPTRRCSAAEDDCAPTREGGQWNTAQRQRTRRRQGSEQCRARVDAHSRVRAVAHSSAIAAASSLASLRRLLPLPSLPTLPPSPTLLPPATPCW